MKLFKQIAVLLFGISVIFVANAGTHSGKSTMTISQIVSTNPEFSTLLTALKKAKLVKVLNSKGEFTVFAPTNKAFSKIPKDKLQALLDNPNKLKKVLLFHVVKGKVMSGQVKPGKVKTLEGQNFTIKVLNGNVMADNAKVQRVDIIASNGVIHVIDSVLLPPKK